MYQTTPYDELYHHGIKGQKWGVRRFQNKDGTRTPSGKKRLSKKQRSKRRRTALKIGAAALGVAAVAGTAYAVRKNPEAMKKALNNAKDSAARYRYSHNNRAVQLLSNEHAAQKYTNKQRRKEELRRAPKDFYDKRMAKMYQGRADRAERRYEKNMHFAQYETDPMKRAKREWNANVADSDKWKYFNRAQTHRDRYRQLHRY